MEQNGPSDDETEVNLKIGKKSRKIIDSDSEGEEIREKQCGGQADARLDYNDGRSGSPSSSLGGEGDGSKSKGRRRIVSIDSDSESDAGQFDSNSVGNGGNSGNNSKSVDAMDVDNKSEKGAPKKQKDREVSEEGNSESDLDEVTPCNESGDRNRPSSPQDAALQKSLFALCDPESSEEEPVSPRDDVTSPILYPKPYRKCKPKIPKSPKMTGREVAKQKLEILSDSQRRMRESSISLPYHVPKARSIREFLQKRPKLAVATSAPPSIAIKMSKDQLTELSKKLDEHIKEVKEFYKSEEEDEEDDISSDVKLWLDIVIAKAVEMSDSKTVGNEVKKASLADLIKEKLEVRPRLSGGPDDVIDLEAGCTRPSRIKTLVDRFMKNSANRRAVHKHKVDLNVVEVSGNGEIVKETVSMNVEDEEEPVTVETPGAKLQKLREELQDQMARRRNEIWKQRRDQGVALETEKTVEGAVEDAVLDDEEEEELTDEPSSEEEEIDEEEEEAKSKCEFMDEEAEESEIEDGTDKGFDADNDDEVEEVVEEPKKKVLKRILKAFDEDSDEEAEEGNKENRMEVTEERQQGLDSTASCDEDFIPPNLPCRTPQRLQRERDNSESDFLTPITYLTSLQSLNSDSKSIKESPVIFNSPSPPKDTNRRPNLQKKLFDEPGDLPQSLEDVAALCSGVFPETQGAVSQLLEEDDKLISQLLEQEVNATGLINSDDETEELEVKLRKRKTVLSSDEEDEVVEEVDYDSEENEIEARTMRIADFVEKEAELSESEWDSADEDEGDLDEMEFEQGDREVFDENEVRSDLERIHMRTMLDEDNREVKLLQELLLEDGELHGSGRQRQFRWRNVDADGGDERRDEEGVFMEEEESEEQWRKMRHQREMFLKQTSVEEGVDSILEDSRVLKVGQEMLKKSQSKSFGSQGQNGTTDEPEIAVKQPFSLLNKRGSFLKRSDQVLQRLAQYHKVAAPTTSTAKNPRCFIFQTVETATTTKKENSKRKAATATPNAVKKLRLADLSPAVNKKGGMKKLFGNVT